MKKKRLADKEWCNMMEKHIIKNSSTQEEVHRERRNLINIIDWSATILFFVFLALAAIFNNYTFHVLWGVITLYLAFSFISWLDRTDAGGR